MEEIVCIKLTSGEEIITKCNETETQYHLNNPRSLTMNAQGGLSFAPVMFSADPDTDIIVLKSAVAAMSHKVRTELEDAYVSSTSKIIVPSKSILMG